MKDVKIKNLTVLTERRRGMRPANTLFNYYVGEVDALNCAKISKDKIATSLNVSARTVANWIRTLSDAGVIKYKYSGLTRLNPEIYFDGSMKNYKKALAEYQRFKADI